MNIDNDDDNNVKNEITEIIGQSEENTLPETKNFDDRLHSSEKLYDERHENIKYDINELKKKVDSLNSFRSKFNGIILGIIILAALAAIIKFILELSL